MNCWGSNPTNSKVLCQDRGLLCSGACRRKISPKSDVYSYGVVRVHIKMDVFLSSVTCIPLILQVVLETYSGEISYIPESSKHPRPDANLVKTEELCTSLEQSLRCSMQVDHLDENLKYIEAFKEVYDRKASECAPYLVKLLFQIVISSLAKHSKRIISEQVSTTVRNLRIIFI